MSTLCVSCTGPEASVLLEASSPGRTQVVKNSEARSHAEFLNLSIAQMLEQENLTLEQIDDLVIDLGPGSFTGVRIDLSFAKAFAYLKQKSIYACSSLVIYDSQNTEPNQLALNAIDGFNGSFYFWLRTLNSTDENFQVGTVERLSQVIREHPAFRAEEKIFIFGNAQSKLIPLLEIAGVKTQSCPPNQTLAELLFALKNKKSLFLKKSSWKQLFPLYLRASAAEEKVG